MNDATGHEICDFRCLNEKRSDTLTAQRIFRLRGVPAGADTFSSVGCVLRSHSLQRPARHALTYECHLPERFPQLLATPPSPTSLAGAKGEHLSGLQRVKAARISNWMMHASCVVERHDKLYKEVIHRSKAYAVPIEQYLTRKEGAKR